MTQGVRILTLYKIIFFSMSEMKMGVQDIEEMVPYELEIYQNLWVIEQKNRAKAANQAALQNRFKRRYK